MFYNADRETMFLCFLAVLDFQIPCLRPETPALYLRSLLIHHECHGQKLGRPRRICGRERSFKDLGRRGRRRPEEPCSGLEILQHLHLV